MRSLAPRWVLCGGFFLAERILLTGEEVRRAVLRMSLEITERNPRPVSVALVGIQTRGVFLAQRLAQHISGILDTTVDVGSLDPRLYRDDPDRASSQALRPTEVEFIVEGRTVVLVDDVLFTGRTIRAAMDALNEFGRPSSIQLAVLVDRGHRQLPIKADFVGKNVPTNRGDNVSVLLYEMDGADEVKVYCQTALNHSTDARGKR